jgi:hypothetical protein
MNYTSLIMTDNKNLLLSDKNLNFSLKKKNYNYNISDTDSRHKYNCKLYLLNYKLYARYGRLLPYHKFLMSYTTWIKIAY